MMNFSREIKLMNIGAAMGNWQYLIVILMISISMNVQKT